MIRWQKSADADEQNETFWTGGSISITTPRGRKLSLDLVADEDGPAGILDLNTEDPSEPLSAEVILRLGDLIEAARPALSERPHVGID